MARKGKDMTAMIRLYNVNSERRDAQLWAKELRDVFVRPFWVSWNEEIVLWNPGTIDT